MIDRRSEDDIRCTHRVETAGIGDGHEVGRRTGFVYNEGNSTIRLIFAWPASIIDSNQRICDRDIIIWSQNV